MKKFVSSVGGIAIGTSLCFGLAPPVWAQNGFPPDRPYLYLWGAPTAGPWYDILPWASQMVRVKTNPNEMMADADVNEANFGLAQGSI